LQVVRGAPLVRIDRGQDLEISRPAVEGDQAEPELLLRAAVEEWAPARVVVLAQPGVRHRQPGRLARVAERARPGRDRERQRQRERRHRAGSHVRASREATVSPRSLRGDALPLPRARDSRYKTPVRARLREPRPFKYDALTVLHDPLPGPLTPIPPAVPPANYVHEHAWARFFGDGLGHPVCGTVSSVRRMTRQAVRSFIARHFVPANMCLALVGGVARDTIRRALARTFPRGARGARLRPP